MVKGRAAANVSAGTLSVLALSSRFDGPQPFFGTPWRWCTFSTRSVESF